MRKLLDFRDVKVQHVLRLGLNGGIVGRFLVSYLHVFSVVISITSNNIFTEDALRSAEVIAHPPERLISELRGPKLICLKLSFKLILI